MDKEDFIDKSEWLSVCCGAHCLGEISKFRDEKDAIGICSDCRDHTSFEKDEDED
jgi:hypothetical protein